jgi:glutamine synthetase
MPGNLSVSQLHAAIAADEIDTVSVAFADALGRLVG